MIKMFVWTTILLISQLIAVEKAAPQAIWKRVLPSIGYHVAIRGDSIVCIGKEITVFSMTGSLRSQSLQLNDTKDVVTQPPRLHFTNDNSVFLLKNSRTAKKITLEGETVWEYDFSDSLPNLVVYGFTEDDAGNMYLCGQCCRQSAVLITIKPDGTYAYRTDTLFYAFYSMAVSGDSLFMVTADSFNVSQKGNLALFDGNGNFIRNVVHAGYRSLIVSDSTSLVVLDDEQSSLSLTKKAIVTTSDIIVRSYNGSWQLWNQKQFDFGLLETALTIRKYHDGLMMITKTQDNIGGREDYLNYFITSLDSTLHMQWQFQLGTDSTCNADGKIHLRFFATDDRGTIVTTHNDSLSCYVDRTLAIGKHHQLYQTARKESGAVYDLKGRFLVARQEGTRPSRKMSHASGSTPGCTIVRIGKSSKTEITPGKP